jgi:hypothetical protein
MHPTLLWVLQRKLVSRPNFGVLPPGGQEGLADLHTTLGAHHPLVEQLPSMAVLFFANQLEPPSLRRRVLHHLVQQLRDLGEV